MAALILNCIGLTLLTHAVYSAYEHSLITHNPASLPTPSLSTRPSLIPNIDLPIDITLETLISVLILCVGIVLSSPELKPIQWRVWAGKLEREKRKITKLDSGSSVDNPYRALDERAGFLDIRAKRAEFAAWVKDGGQKGRI